MERSSITPNSAGLRALLMPLGGLVGGALVTGVGLSPALVIVGFAYLATTMAPAFLPSFRQMNRQPNHHDRLKRRHDHPLMVVGQTLDLFGRSSPADPDVPPAEPLSGCLALWPTLREPRLPASRVGIGCGTPTWWAISVVPTRPRSLSSPPVVGVEWRGRPWCGRHRKARRLRGCCTHRYGRARPGALPAFG